MESIKRPNIIPEKIEIRSIRIISGNINCPSNSVLGLSPIHNFETTYIVDSKVNPSDKLILFLFTTLLDARDDNNSKMPINAEYLIEFIFHIDNFDDYKVDTDINLVQDVKTTFEMDEMFMATLMGIVYSTARGIILQRTVGTILNGVIIPVIDPKILLKGNLLIDKEN
ncbi:MAG: hypothetical protein Q8R57_10400 [Bacteroidota bacterium]|nr:hypothetical protein [Bacteroidota bacterium]